MCLRTSTNPITASRSACSTSSTPAARISSPPMPVRRYGAPRAESARATPEAWRSPDASPATKRISRTGARHAAAGKRRERPLDVGDDLQRDRQRLAASLAADRHRRLAAHGGQEALELEPKRLPLVRSQRDAFDELLERQGRGRQRGDVHVAAQPEELSLATAQVERQIATLLKDAQLAHPLARHAARRDVRHRAGV